jgi:predicted acetyltransferase
MEQAKLVRVVEITPDGPGLVIEVAGVEAFIRADDAALWIVELGYNVFTPVRFSVGVDKFGVPAPSEFEPSDDDDAG